MRRLPVLLVIALVLAAATGCGDLAPTINNASPQPELQVLKGSSDNNFSVDAEDPEGQTLTYQWSATSGAPLTSTEADFSWTAPNEVGVSTISVTVSDGKNTTIHSWRVNVVTVLANMTTISGVVRGSIPNTVIYKATVTAETTGGARFAALTDMNGAYTLHVPVGQYDLTAEMESFNPATAQVASNGASPTAQDFTLTTTSGGTIAAPYGFPNIDGHTNPMLTDFRSNGRSAPAGYECIGYLSYGLYKFTDAIQGVRFYRSSSSSGPFTLVKVLPIDRYTNNVKFEDRDSSFSPGQSVYYYMTAWGPGGESASMPQYPGRADFPEPLVLSSPAAGEVISTATTPTFRWTQLSQSANYSVTLERLEGSTWTYIWGHSASSTDNMIYSGAPLTAGTYRWSMELYLSAGNGRAKSYYRALTVQAP